MKRLRFTADYDHRPDVVTTIAYKSGKAYSVADDVAVAALGKGRATEIKPRRTKRGN